MVADRLWQSLYTMRDPPGESSDAGHQSPITNHQLPITGVCTPATSCPPAGPDSADPHRAPGNAFKPYTFNAF